MRINPIDTHPSPPYATPYIRPLALALSINMAIPFASGSDISDLPERPEIRRDVAAKKFTIFCRNKSTFARHHPHFL
jgi:hypothetical protein